MLTHQDPCRKCAETHTQQECYKRATLRAKAQWGCLMTAAGPAVEALRWEG
jgi:hypothetical protein